MNRFESDQTADLRVVVKENQLMEAAIMRVDKARFELKLSLRKSDTMPNPEKVRVSPSLRIVLTAPGRTQPRRKHLEPLSLGQKDKL